MQVLALSVVSIGVSVATVTDLQFHLFGFFIALAWIIPSAGHKILWSNLQQRENWTALAYVIIYNISSIDGNLNFVIKLFVERLTD